MQYKSSTTKKKTAAIGRFIRALHTYSAMWVLLLLVFFSITGITLNHPTWQSKLGAQQSLAVLALPDTFKTWPTTVEQYGYAAALASWLQQQGVKAVSWQPRFEDDEQTLELSFKRPAGYAVALVDFHRAQIELEQQFSGYLALANDLHKGRDTGVLWKWLIDITAIVCLVFAITGFYLLLKMPSKKSAGNALAAIGGMMALLAYLISLY